MREMYASLLQGEGGREMNVQTEESTTCATRRMDGWQLQPQAAWAKPTRSLP